MEGPLSPDEVGVGTGVILVATLLLALLGALVVLLIGRAGMRPALAPSELRPSASRAPVMRRGWRYPTRP